MRKKNRLRALEKQFNAKKEEVGRYRQNNMAKEAATETQNLELLAKQLSFLAGDFNINIKK